MILAGNNSLVVKSQTYISPEKTWRRLNLIRRSRAAKKMTLGNPVAAASADDYDRLKEVKEFDDSKVGVRGLVESGAATIPRFFRHPPENLSLARPPTALSVPTIDLSDLHTDRRSAIVRQIADASRTWGFFQVTNHGIPLSVIDDAISAVRSFHEQPAAVRSTYYSRTSRTGVAYNTNVDLFQSKAASWRDTLQVQFGPEPLDAERIPEICRKELVAWDENARRVAEVLLEVLSEGLGVERGKLKEMTCSEARLAAAHYYPCCPEPDQTLGLGWHADPGVVTVVVQNEIGGLQVKHGEEWAEVKPLRGALVVNIGDLLQIISNDEYKSVEHRVVANPHHDPRVSIAIFFNPSKRGEGDLFGPLPELLSEDKPAHYRNFTMAEFFQRFFNKELGAIKNYFRL